MNDGFDSPIVHQQQDDIQRKDVMDAVPDVEQQPQDQNIQADIMRGKLTKPINVFDLRAADDEKQQQPPLEEINAGNDNDASDQFGSSQLKVVKMPSEDQFARMRNDPVDENMQKYAYGRVNDRSKKNSFPNSPPERGIIRQRSLDIENRNDRGDFPVDLDMRDDSKNDFQSHILRAAEVNPNLQSNDRNEFIRNNEIPIDENPQVVRRADDQFLFDDGANNIEIRPVNHFPGMNNENNFLANNLLDFNGFVENSALREVAMEKNLPDSFDKLVARRRKIQQNRQVRARRDGNRPILKLRGPRRLLSIETLPLLEAKSGRTSDSNHLVRSSSSFPDSVDIANLRNTFWSSSSREIPELNFDDPRTSTNSTATNTLDFGKHSRPAKTSRSRSPASVQTRPHHRLGSLLTPKKSKGLHSAPHSLPLKSLLGGNKKLAGHERKVTSVHVHCTLPALTLVSML